MRPIFITFSLLGYNTEHPQFKGREVNFGSHFCSKAERHGGKDCQRKTAHIMAARKQIAKWGHEKGYAPL